MQSPAAICLSSGGVVRTAELRSSGASRRAISAAVAQGELLRVRSGVYVHPQLPWAERHAIAHGGRLGCVSAAAALGLWTLPFSGLHVSVPSAFHSFEHAGCTEDVKVHWSRTDAFAADRRLVALSEAIREIGRCQGPEGALVVIESGLHASHLSLGGSDLDVLRRIWPEGRKVIDFAGDQADSGLESLMRWRLSNLGISSVPQYRIDGVGRVDLLVGERLILELDGGTHADPGAVGRDRRRDAVSAAAGFRTERYGYQQMIYAWPEVRKAVLTIIERGEHLHRPRRAYR